MYQWCCQWYIELAPITNWCYKQSLPQSSNENRVQIFCLYMWIPIFGTNPTKVNMVLLDVPGYKGQLQFLIIFYLGFQASVM